MIHIVLFEPEIPSNTGNIMRLCANMGAKLHLIKPYGFTLDDKKLRRAGMDYKDIAVITEYDCFAEFVLWHQKNYPNNQLYCLTTKTDTLYTSVTFSDNDALVFGPETRGLPEEIREAHHTLTIPMQADSRSLNLSNSAAIVSYEMWRQLGFINS